MSHHAQRHPDPETADSLVHRVAALERTALAWERTAISLAAAGMFLVKLVDEGPLIRAAGMALVAGGLAASLLLVPLGYRRTRARLIRDGGEALDATDRIRPRVLLLTATLVTVTVAGAATDLLWHRLHG